MFEEIMAEIGGGENNSEETLDTGQDTGFDNGDAAEQGQGQEEGGDNSPETAPGFDPNSITDPQLRQQYQQMQAAFTPRLQEAADLRQRYGDLEPAVVDAVREYQRLLQTDPWGARNYLAQQQSYLDQHLGQQQPRNPFEGVEPLTPTEKALLDVSQQMWQQQQQLQQESQQLRFQRFQEQMERQFAQLETQFKAKIPLEDRQQVAAYMQASGIKDVGAAWKVLNFDKALQAGTARQQKIAQQKKQQPAPPANRNPRTPSNPGTPSAKGKTIGDMLSDAWSRSSS